MHPTLLIDTAFEQCQVGLAVDGQLIDQRISTSGGGHDRVLAGMVQEILHAKSMTAQDLARIAITTGPGRFTGLRVGLAFARGLALVHRTPLCGLNTADLLAIDLLDSQSDIPDRAAVLLSVKRGESYVRSVAPVTGPIERVMDEELLSYLTKDGPTRVGGFISPETQALLGSQPDIRLLPGLQAPRLATMARQASQTQTLPSSALRPYYGA